MPDVFVAEEDKTQQVAAKPHHKGKRKRDMHPFKSYLYRPHWVKFENQQNGEEVLLLLRRHVVTNIPWIFFSIILIFAPMVLTNFPIISFLPENFQMIAIMFWYLVTFAYILENFLIWFFNVSIVTNKRIIDIDFVNLLYKEVADAEIEKIEDVTYKIGGAVRTIFNYGDVLIQTASEVPNFDFSAVPKPNEVGRLLQELRELDG